MKVGIVTLHNSFSYGACLQAYALYRAVSNMGHTVEFVNYVNKFEQNQNHLISNRKDLGIVKNIKITILNVILGRYINRCRAFRKFHTRYKLSKRYTNLTDMTGLNYDILLSGSDQLWNPDIFGGIDQAYLLNFGFAVKRVAYAASAGSHKFSEQERELIYPLLRQYNAISVREENLKEQLSNMLKVDLPMVLDPSFLLSPQEWLTVPSNKPVIDKKYILLYMINVPYKYYKIHYAKIVRYYAEKLNAKVYAITSDSFPTYYCCDNNLSHITPEDFIHIINGAQLLISSSFHGIAFAINLNCKFVALKSPNPARVQNLLHTCGLESRIIDSFDESKCESLLNDIDYTPVNSIINSLRTRSYNWLKEQLIL